MHFTRLAELRKRNKYSQREVCERLGLKQNSLSQWEIGTRSVDAATAIKLAKFYQVSVDYLLGVSDIENPQENAASPEQARIINRIVQADGATCREVEQFMNYMDYKNNNVDEEVKQALAEKK